jgi:DivIVA domain-containing protein
MSEPLSPEDIEKATFTSTHGGYDPDEVAVFLKSVANDMRSLIRKQETAKIATERPYHALGREIADLLEEANEAAMRAKKMAETEASNILQEAHKSSHRDREEAQHVRRRAEAEALVVRDEAHAAADRLTSQAEQARRLAEAEGQILQQEARREIKRLKEQAREYAAKTKAASDFDARERARETEQRVRRLQEAETVLRGRIRTLKARLDELTGRVEAAEAARGPEVETASPQSHEPAREVNVTDDALRVAMEPRISGAPEVIRIDASDD